MSGVVPSPSEAPTSQFMDRFLVPSLGSAFVLRSCIHYKPRDDDVFIVTYPKCGTNWIKKTVELIFQHGKPADSFIEFVSNLSSFDRLGAAASKNMPRPYAFKTHLPFHLIPWSDKAKYIYVTRNPKDVCVSYYYHTKYIQGNEFALTFDQFFELFLSGDVYYGNYFDHVMEWHEHRNDPNVLFVSYEEMTENPEATVLTLASFLDEEKYAKPLREDPEKMQNVLKFNSFKYMKEISQQHVTQLLSMKEDEIRKLNIPEEKKKMLIFYIAILKKAEVQKQPPDVSFVRKGIVGDWKNYFNEQQSKRMDQTFAERSKDRDFQNIWKYM